jgi:predicted TIM-barrel fold metal-dependent hydrolase
MDELNRRHALSLGLAVAAAPLLTLGGAGATPAAAQEASRSSVNGVKVIDFRVRPPLAIYKPLFDVHLRRAGLTRKMANIPENAISPSMRQVGTDEGLDLLISEMDEAGVDAIVAPGRQATVDAKLVGGPDGETVSITISDQELVDLRKRFNNRLYGLTALDLGKPADQLADQIKTAITDFGLSGVVMEPGYYKADDGSQLWADNEKLSPIYEAIIEADTFLMHQSGIYAGPDIGVNNWAPVDRLMQKFPKLKLLLAHGGYPEITQALALAAKHENVWLSSDVYNFFPGGEQYVNAISRIPDQFVYASAYSLATLKESVDETLKFPLTPKVMEKYMYDNAAYLLKIS